MDFNRKDASPENTIKRIENILSSIPIEVQVINHVSNNDQLYSCRLEFENLSGVGTNGKGISREFSEAGAYAEFMERFQAGMLLDNWFPVKQVSENKKNDCVNIICCDKEYYSCCKEIIMSIDKEEASKLLSLDKSYSILTPYLDMITGEYKSMPEKLISLLCGSNGLSSGNTFIEACVQGLCEVFERYVYTVLYKHPKTIFPTINENLYRHTKSYKLIETIRNKGYEVIVKDCTLNGKLPVLGVIILSPSRAKYKLSLGSDINFDICLQRCLTEAFQGLDFVTMKSYMKDFKVEYDNYWCLKNPGKELLKSFKSARGNIPRSLLLDNEYSSSTTPLKPFIECNIRGCVRTLVKTSQI